MKLQGIVGTGSGKLGASVFVVRHGEQIVRTYQPVVSDAKSTAQVEVRAKMKLMVQLAAVLSQGLGFKRVGNISPRNRFFSANYGKVTMVDGEARIGAEVLDISGGVIALTTPTATHAAGAVSVELSSSEPNLDRVVYVLVEKVGTSSYVRGVVAAEPGADAHFTAVFPMGSAMTGYVLAYGLKFIDKAARVHFENLLIDGTTYALAYLRTLTDGQSVTTVTRYVSVSAAATSTAKAKGKDD